MSLWAGDFVSIMRRESMLKHIAWVRTKMYMAVCVHVGHKARAMRKWLGGYRRKESWKRQG